MIRMRTDVDAKEVKQYKLSGFRGVDFTSSPLNVKETRSPDATNWIYDHGTPAKRHGWNQIAYVGNYKVNGVYEYSTGYLLVYAGTKFFNVRIITTGVGYTCTEISTTTIDPTSTLLVDRRIQFFPQGDNRVFIVGAGIYLVWAYYSSAWHLEKVFDNSLTYIPTTTISIDYNGYSGTSVTSALEKPNYMTVWRKNTCRGVVGSATESPIVERKFQLDGLVNPGDMEAKYDDGANSVPAAFVTVVYLDSLSVEHTLNLKAYYSYNADPDAVQYANLVETYGGTNYGTIDETGELTLTGVITEPGTVADNITVTFMAFVSEVTPVDDLFTGRDNIDRSQFGVMYGVGGVTTMLFVGGNTTDPNKDYYSYPLDMTYWPDNFHRIVGNSAITGYHRIADGALVIFKAKANGEAAIFLRTGTLQTAEDDGYYNAEIVYSEKAGYASNYLVSRGTIDTLSGDPLYLTESGVKGIELSDNVSTDERFARRRSYFIDKKLEDYTLTDAQAYVLDDRYYLCVEDDCFVADARLKASGETSDTFNYEWMFWGNIPARTLFERGGELAFGTVDGRICVFDDEYTDRTFEAISSGDLSLHAADDEVVFAAGIVVADEDQIRFSNDKMHELLMTSSTSTRSANKITATSDAAKARVLIMNELEEMLIIADDESATTAYAKNVDYGDYSFELVDEDDVAIDMSSGFTSYQLIEPLDGVDLYVNEPDANSFQVSRHSDTEAISLTYYDADTPNIDDTQVFAVAAIVITAENVEAEWLSCVSNLGSSFTKKTLLSLTIVATGEMTFGYLTRIGDLATQYEKFDGFSLDDFDFTRFTFSALTESMTKRVKERNVNFVVFEIISDTARAATINEITVRFHYNTVIRGVL